jgi:hypothetical protein
MRVPIFLILLICSRIIGLPTDSYAQMINGKDLQQDRAKLQLCIDRARNSRTFGIGDQDLVPFEIDASYVARVRQDVPNVTFFAIPGRLVECEVAGNGLYSPAVMSGENWFWHVIRPPSFQPPINTEAGTRRAAEKCLGDVPTQADLPRFDHAGYFSVNDVGYISPKISAGPNRPVIAGVPVASYDVEVTGVAYFKTNTIDLTMLMYVCLYSPMLELKVVGWRRDIPGRRIWLKSALQAAAQKSQSTR